MRIPLYVVTSKQVRVIEIESSDEGHARAQSEDIDFSEWDEVGIEYEAERSSPSRRGTNP